MMLRNILTLNLTGERVKSPMIRLESYSLVLSVSILVVCMVFGLAASMTIICSMFVSRQLRKLRYALLHSILIVSLIFGCLWAPMEMYHLLCYYHHGKVSQKIKIFNYSLYMFLITIIAFSIGFIAVRSLILLLRRNGHGIKRKLIYSALPISWAAGLIIAISYGVISINIEPRNSYDVLHIMMNTSSLKLKISLLTIYILSLIVLLLVLLTCAKVKSSEDANDDVSEDSDIQAEMAACLPGDSATANDDQAADDKSQVSTPGYDRSASPQMPVIPQKPLNDDDDDTDESSQQQGCLPTKRKNSLQLNLGNILNRRRHTICQMGELKSERQPIEYNYVRKFSVDIVALQAQLENPKLHGGKSPFADRNLKDGQLTLPEVTIGIKKENGSLRLKESRPSLPSIQEDENEDVLEGTATSPLGLISEHFARRQSAAIRQLHIKLQSVKFASLLIATFLLCILPLYITDTLHASISLTAYINIITCTSAISIVQIIVYPNIFLCMDRTIHNASQQLFEYVRERLIRRGQHSSIIIITDHSDCNATQL